MARIVAVEPIFAVADMQRAAEHYKRLGFEVSYYDDGYAFVQRQGVNLHLDLSDTSPPGGGLLYLHVDDADELAAECVRRGQTLRSRRISRGASTREHTPTRTATPSDSARPCAAEAASS